MAAEDELRHDRGDGDPGVAGMRANPSCQPGRQLDREHRGGLRSDHPAGLRGPLRIPAGLPHRAPELPGQLARCIGHRHAGLHQIRCGIDALGILIRTDAVTSHAINVLPDMSQVAGDTPWPFQPAITQRDLEAEVIHCVGGVVSPLLANVYLHYVFDWWARSWRRRHARGDMVVTRFADDFVVGFQHLGDAKRFLSDLRERFAKFNLELHPDKTRLIEFGRFAASNRKKRGLAKPETFDFLGFTHICGKTRDGRFWLRRVTIKKRLRAKLKQVKAELRRRRHWPIPEQGPWLASVVRGHLAYYAVPGNIDAVSAFRDQVRRHWRETLRRRSQRSRMTWGRFSRIADRWLPPARIVHPYPSVRFAARTQGRSPLR